MLRYNDRVKVFKPIGDVNNPYNEPEYEEVYSGRCRCYQHDQYDVDTKKWNHNNYQICVPDSKMLEVGENWKVEVTKGVIGSKVSGDVSYFIRFDKVCYINFDRIKDNEIEEE